MFVLRLSSTGPVGQMGVLGNKITVNITIKANDDPHGVIGFRSSNIIKTIGIQRRIIIHCKLISCGVRTLRHFVLGIKIKTNGHFFSQRFTFTEATFLISTLKSSDIASPITSKNLVIAHELLVLLLVLEMYANLEVELSFRN